MQGQCGIQEFLVFLVIMNKQVVGYWILTEFEIQAEHQSKISLIMYLPQKVNMEMNVSCGLLGFCAAYSLVRFLSLKQKQSRNKGFVINVCSRTD